MVMELMNRYEEVMYKQLEWESEVMKTIFLILIIWQFVLKNQMEFELTDKFLELKENKAKKVIVIIY